MLSFTATAVGGAVHTGNPTGNVIADSPNVEVLEDVTVTGTGSGVGVLQTASVGGYAGWLLAAVLGATIAIGYYIDFQGVQHDAAFSYTAKVATVRIDGRVYTGVALDTTSTAPEPVAYVDDQAGGVWKSTDDASASL